MTFNQRSQQRIGDVVRRVEKSPLNAGAGKRRRRQQAGISAKHFQVKQAKDGEEFVDYADYHTVTTGQRYYFTCAPVKILNQSKYVSEIEEDEQKWVQVYNLAREWIPENSLITAWQIAGEWYCHHQRVLPPTIVVTGTVETPSSTFSDFTMLLDTCSLGRVQHEIGETDLHVTVQNIGEKYADNGFQCAAIGSVRTDMTESYLDEPVDLYGDSVSEILAAYQFILLSVGCG